MLIFEKRGVGLTLSVEVCKVEVTYHLKHTAGLRLYQRKAQFVMHMHTQKHPQT